MFPCTCSGCVGEFSGHSDCWRGLLSAGRPASHHPQQHRSRSGVRTTALQLQQVHSPFSHFARVSVTTPLTCVHISPTVLEYLLRVTETTTLTTWSSGCGSVCGRRSSAWCSWPLTPASWFSTSPGSPRRASPASSASSSSTMPSRRCSSSLTTTPSTPTLRWTTSRNTTASVWLLLF